MVGAFLGFGGALTLGGAFFAGAFFFGADSKSSSSLSSSREKSISLDSSSEFQALCFFLAGGFLAGAEAEEGRRAAQGPGQEAAGQEEKRLELRRGVEWRAVSRSGAFSLGARRRDDVEAPPPLTEPAQARTTSP